MRNAYVVMQKGFEYNDEIYYEIDGGVGHPSKIFFTKEACEEEVERLNIEEIMKKKLSYYFYDIEDICDDPEGLKEYCDSLNKKYGEKVKSRDDNEYLLHSSATFEEAKKYYDMINISFYESVEVEIDQQDMREAKISNVFEN